MSNMYINSTRLNSKKTNYKLHKEKMNKSENELKNNNLQGNGFTIYEGIEGKVIQKPNNENRGKVK